MKQINLTALNEWIVCQGPQAKELLSYKTGIGYFTIGRILRGERQPTKPEQLALIQATGLNEAELFSTDESKKQPA